MLKEVSDAVVHVVGWRGCLERMYRGRCSGCCIDHFNRNWRGGGVAFSSQNLVSQSGAVQRCRGCSRQLHGTEGRFVYFVRNNKHLPRHDQWDCHICAYIEVVSGINDWCVWFSPHNTLNMDRSVTSSDKPGPLWRSQTTEHHGDIRDLKHKVTLEITSVIHVVATIKSTLSTLILMRHSHFLRVCALTETCMALSYKHMATGRINQVSNCNHCSSL